MSMTKEEAKKHIVTWFYSLEDYELPPLQVTQALQVAISSLRPITREQAEKMRGEWIDADGENVPVDKYGQPFGWAKCSACGEYLTASDEYPCIGNFCPNCGAPMTGKAVETIMKRMEEMRND